MAAADLQSAVLEMFAGLEADERLAGQGLAEAFAEAFPNLPDASAVPGLTSSTSWAPESQKNRIELRSSD